MRMRTARLGQPGRPIGRRPGRPRAVFTAPRHERQAREHEPGPRSGQVPICANGASTYSRPGGWRMLKSRYGMRPFTNEMAPAK